MYKVPMGWPGLPKALWQIKCKISGKMKDGPQRLIKQEVQGYGGNKASLVNKT